MRIILLLFLLFAIIKSVAQTDSVINDTTKKYFFFKSRYITESTVPLGLAAGSAIIMSIPGLKQQLQQKLNWNTEKYRDENNLLVSNPDYINLGDDYIRYAPTVAAYALSFSGFKSKHQFIDRSAILIFSYIFSDFVVHNTKNLTKELRPLGNAANSFPSQHTAMAFVGATFLDHELGYISPWITVAGYTVASYVGYCRIARNAHWTNDVLMGAAVGMLTTHMTYWAYDGLMKIFSKKQISLSPYFDTNHAGMYLSYNF